MGHIGTVKANPFASIFGVQVRETAHLVEGLIIIEWDVVQVLVVVWNLRRFPGLLSGGLNVLLFGLLFTLFVLERNIVGIPMFVSSLSV